MLRTLLTTIGLFLFLAASSLAEIWAGEQASSETSSAPTLDFRFDVLPVLSKNCFACHGMDESHREADLRLDDREVAIEFGAIVPGSPEESELIRRIISEDVEERMPPQETGKRLTEGEIATLQTWIAEGAKYSLHWAYEVPERPALPQVLQPEWCRNEIDHFILSGLQRSGLAPEDEADPYRLIRRLSLDLTGLPPSAVEADEFADNPSSEAYERLVDRLLESPAYGEHWAWKWLDLARYADTCGYEKDTPRTIWPYRDWVIRALNDDMPFDQFTIEQIAGDMLPEPTREQIIATAFHRNTMQNDEGGADDEEFRVAAIVDRVSTTMQVWMGTTMGCARCHSHKYDPLTQREFYELFAFFNQTADADRFDQEPLLITPSPADEKLQAKLDAIADSIKEAREELADNTRSDQSEWEAAVRGTFQWHPLALSSADSETGQSCAIMSDASVQISGQKADVERYVLEGQSDLNQITALKLETLPDSSESQASSDRGFVLSRIRVVPAEFEAPNDVRYVRLEIPERHQYLKMAEVEVYRGKENIGPTGTATQSSTAYEGYPELAIDGRTDPDFGGSRSTSHTAFNLNPWWEVDLRQSTTVDRLSLWASAENQYRLAGSQFTLLDASRKPVWQQMVHFAPDMSLTFFPSTTPYPQLMLAGADSEHEDYPAMHAIENREAKAHGWSPGPETGCSHELCVGFEKPWNSQESGGLRVTLEQHSERSRSRLRRFRLWATDDPRAAQAATVPPEVRAIAHIAVDQRSEEQTKQITEYYQSVSPRFQELAAQKQDVALRMTEELKLDKTPIMRELPPEEMRKTHVHVRGNFLELGEAVEPATPKVFHEMPADAPRNRLGLAQWLVDRRNPLTARVVANRQWEQLFGNGIVRTSEDFGSQGTLPSNPALLDWLATELMDHDWSLKHLTKTIVMSAAYRQSAAISPEKLSKDPENLLVSRGPSHRLAAEQIRDQALFASDLLSQKMYGPSVMPYQPDGVWQVVYSDYRWETSCGEDLYRRGLYTYWRRTSPYPSAMALDATSRETCTVRRIMTNTPVAAFALLNDPVYVEAAQTLAEAVLRHDATDTSSRARYAFRKVLVRPPTEVELRRISDLYELQLERYQGDIEAAEALTGKKVNDAQWPNDLPALAAWTVVGNVLLNLDETLTK